MNQDLYDLNITISIYDYIRDETKFESVEELKKQLEKDKITSLNYFQK